MKTNKENKKMYTYRVVIGGAASISADVYLVRAKNCAQAEEIAMEYAGDDFEEGVHVTNIEQLDGEFLV